MRKAAEKKPLWRRIASWIGTLALLGVVYLVWPQPLGGRVAYIRVSGHSMERTYQDGDLVMVWRDGHYRKGEIVVYKVPADEAGAGNLIVHRIAGGDGRDGFVTHGDNNSWDDPWHPKTSDVIGRVIVHIPNGAQYMALLHQPLVLAGMASAVSVVATYLSLSEQERDKKKHKGFGILKPGRVPVAAFPVVIRDVPDRTSNAFRWLGPTKPGSTSTTTALAGAPMQPTAGLRAWGISRQA